MPTAISLPRLKSFIRECGGFIWAARKLHVHPHTLRRILRREFISDQLRQRVKSNFNNIAQGAQKKIISDLQLEASTDQLSGRTEGNIQTESNLPLLTSFIKKCGGTIQAAWKLNVRPSTLEKVLAGHALSEPTRAKLEGFLESDTDSESPKKSRGRFEILSSKLKEIIKDKVDIIESSSRLSVKPSTIQKILDGHPVSSSVEKKVLAAFETEPSKSATSQISMVERLKEIYRLYEQEGTLQAVGRKIGVTRERVRQLLAKGTELGLFEYKPFDYPFVPKEKLLEDYKVHLNLNRLAKVNNITSSYLHKLLTAYGITEEDLRSVRIAGQKMRCVDGYNRIKDEVGHHPTTTELQRSKSWRYLSMKIARLWGSFDAFREELSIPKPPQGSPSFREDTRRWRETQQRLALIVRMQHLDRIRECLNTSRPMSTTEIAYDCGLPGQRTLTLLKLLVATGDVIREGTSGSTKYRLAKD